MSSRARARMPCAARPNSRRGLRASARMPCAARPNSKRGLRARARAPPAARPRPRRRSPPAGGALEARLVAAGAELAVARDQFARREATLHQRLSEVAAEFARNLAEART